MVKTIQNDYIKICLKCREKDKIFLILIKYPKFYNKNKKGIYNIFFINTFLFCHNVFFK